MRLREKESNKTDDRDEAYEGRIQAEKEEEREKGGTNSPSTSKFFRKVQGVGHYRGSHTPFASLPLLRRAHVNHNALGWPLGETFGLRTRRKLKIYPL